MPLAGFKFKVNARSSGSDGEMPPPVGRTIPFALPFALRAPPFSILFKRKEWDIYPELGMGCLCRDKPTRH